MHHADFAYARARLQARHGSLPDAGVWRLLEASHTSGHYLSQARTGPLAPRLEGMADEGDARRIERHLRGRWQRYVAEVASWQPPDWQAAVRWFGTLPELPLVDNPLESDRAAAWVGEWQRLMPLARKDAGAVFQVAALLMPRLPVAADAPEAGRGRRATERAAAPEPVRQALLKLFRRHGASPVAAFAHLALVALDLERLRGGIVSRVLLGPSEVTGLVVSAGTREA